MTDDQLVARFGTARRPERALTRHRPDGAGDELVAALGLLSDALEVVEHARGLLYGFHRLSGHADLTLQRAVRGLRAAGAGAAADTVDTVLVGRDVIPGRWTFQIVEDYDAHYWSAFRAVAEHTRVLLGAPPHLYEAEMRHREQAAGTDPA